MDLRVESGPHEQIQHHHLPPEESPRAIPSSRECFLSRSVDSFLPSNGPALASVVPVIVVPLDSTQHPIKSPSLLDSELLTICILSSLVLVILQFFPRFSTVSPALAALPLLVVLAVSALKDGYEDLKRHQSDRAINGIKVSLLRTTRVSRTDRVGCIRFLLCEGLSIIQIFPTPNLARSDYPPSSPTTSSSDILSTKRPKQTRIERWSERRDSGGSVEFVDQQRRKRRLERRVEMLR